MRFELSACVLGSSIMAALAAWLGLWMGGGWILAIVIYTVVGSVVMLVSAICLQPGRNRRGVHKPGRFHKNEQTASA